MRSDDDTEITLGVGKLLGLFFVLAAICGVFFSIGYSLGRSSGREQALGDQPAQVNADSGAATSTPAAGESKPSAAVANSQAQVPTTNESDAANQSGHFTFYKAVQQNDDGSQVAEPAQSAAASPAPKAVAAAAPAENSTASAAPRASTTPTTPKAGLVGDSGPVVVSHSSPVTGPGTLVVQIAAVSREDDAVALAGALRKKNYNVFVVNNPVTHDRFFHVQVGPFSTLAQAEATKSKLSAEGYNPIIKK